MRGGVRGCACVGMMVLPSAITALETSWSLGCVASGLLLKHIVELSAGGGCRWVLGEAG